MQRELAFVHAAARQPQRAEHGVHLLMVDHGRHLPGGRLDVSDNGHAFLQPGERHAAPGERQDFEVLAAIRCHLHGDGQAHQQDWGQVRRLLFLGI